MRVNVLAVLLLRNVWGRISSATPHGVVYVIVGRLRRLLPTISELDLLAHVDVLGVRLGLDFEFKCIRIMCVPE